MGCIGSFHALVVVKNLNNIGDLHLFEVGIGYPTFRPIPLKLSGKLIDCTDIIKESFLMYKFVTDGNVFRRFHLKPSIDTKNKKSQNPITKTNDIQIDGAWDHFYSFELIPISIDEVRYYLTLNGNFGQDISFNRQLLICKYPNGRYFGVKGFQEGHEYVDAEGTPQTNFIPVADRDVFIRICSDNFPEIPADVVSKALIYWNIHKSK